ncbi:c6 zinc finger domain containing protein [Niveomyces insectorum RCEF 264]|uniref:C6 zinc finger domain containing protein n=1 Tax=Niveomyces insectorum RCEF 264 TaxID=1081102 RepID=A0A167RDT4_9HYPO|nr:c6 zinc finger domain containing protein [Niveomyces insectorum RCEF 264]
MQAVWGSETPEIDESVPPKRQRLFIARQREPPQACETCRQKKTRCDGGHPCGLCQAAGVDCKFAERKATKNEVSLGMIFNTLQRIESKIEQQQQQGHNDSQQYLLRKRDRHGSMASYAGGGVRSPSEAVPLRRLSTNAGSPDLASPSASAHSRDGVVVVGGGGGDGSSSGIHALLTATSPIQQQQYHAVADDHGGAAVRTPTPALPHHPLHHHQARPPQPRHVPVIQYPIRQLARWPAVRAAILPKDRIPGVVSGVDDIYTYDAAVATVLEQRRPPLPLPLSLALPTPTVPTAVAATVAAATASPGNWLAQLHISVIKDLGDSYFSTFNLTNPVLDRKLFSQHSLGVAINSAFGVNIESCVVLVTMALGTLGRRSLRAAGFGVQAFGDKIHRAAEDAAVRHGVYGDEEDDPWDDGLIFFNEARKRIGLLGYDNSLQACQYHLLCGLFYSQLLRPVDWWATVSRASICCTSFWACLPKDCDEWTLDMQARLFWITAMFEAVLTQELDLPVSNLLEYEDRVPLPKFVAFPGVSSFVALMTTTSSATTSSGSSGGGSIGGGPPADAQEAAEQQDAFCHYHFLSQIAHRIILTRLCDSMFANRTKALAAGTTAADAARATTLARSDYPPQALEDELLHQLEQWRSQLPEYLQWVDADIDGNDDAGYRERDGDSTVPWYSTAPMRIQPTTPANIFVVPWLQARYWIAQYHLRRPLLHRALHHPDWMTPHDFAKCQDAIDCAMRWCAVIRQPIEIMDCLPLKFFLCTQFFGLLLLFHTFESATVPELRQLVPSFVNGWRLYALSFLEKCAVSAPSVAREYEIVSSLSSSIRALSMNGSTNRNSSTNDGNGLQTI